MFRCLSFLIFLPSNTYSTSPSADTVSGFAERARIERGQMVGPRIFTVGRIIYGAAGQGFHQDIVDMDQAKEALVRIKVEGGPASISYKNYNLPSRASRQRLLKVAQDIGMLCVPEGGMNLDWDLTYIIDGAHSFVNFSNHIIIIDIICF